MCMISVVIFMSLGEFDNCAYPLFRLNFIVMCLSSLEGKLEIFREVVAYLHYMLRPRVRLFDKNCLQVQYFASYHRYRIAVALLRESYSFV